MITYEWNEHFADSVLGQQSASIALQRFKPFKLFRHLKKGCSIAEGFHLLDFPLDKSYVHT